MNLSPVRFRGHTVLIISSDLANLQLMTQLIATRNDLKLLTARNGSDGLKLTRTTQLEVVVMDTTLSGICASEVLKGLRGNHPVKSVKVR